MEVNDFTVGQKVFTGDFETEILELHGDGTCTIKNPGWDWDEEGEAVTNGESYNEPYKIRVKISDLSLTPEIDQ